MNTPQATITAAAYVIAAVRRRWGRYQHRLAVGRASLGRPHHALRHTLRATTLLDRAGASSLELGEAFDTLAGCYQQLGQLEAATQARLRAVNVLEVVDPDRTEWVAALVKLGDLYRFQGAYDHAERVLSQAVDGAARMQQSTDAMPPRAAALNALGIVYKDTGRYDAAASAYSEALDLVTTATGPEHPCAAALWHNLAGLAYAQGHQHQAETLATRAVRLHERQLGPDHHLVAQDLAVLGVTILDQGRVDEAEAIFERALAIFRRRHPTDQYEVAVNLGNLAACSVARGDLANAEQLFRDGLTIRQAILGFDHPETARQLNNIAVVVAQLHRTDEAVELHGQALAILEHTLPASHPLTAICRANAPHGASVRSVNH